MGSSSSTRSTASSLMTRVCAELSPEIPELRPVAPDVSARAIRPVIQLSWWNERARAELVTVLLGTAYEVAWLDVFRGDDEQRAPIPRATLRAVHAACVGLRKDLVLFVAVHAASANAHDLHAAGAGSEGRVGVLSLLASNGALDLGRLAKLARGPRAEVGPSLFDEAIRTFDVRKELAATLGRVMALLEETAGRRASESGLAALREAAAVITFRVVFLMEVEGRRGILYRPGCRPSGHFSLFELAERARTDRRARRAREDSLLIRVRELTDDIRRGRGGVALSGGGIFANAPNDDFDPDVTAWLDHFDRCVPNDAWHEALADAGDLGIHHIEAHDHKALGEMYERILAMTPTRGPRGEPLLTDEGGAGRSDRKALAAHYTPEAMVVEMVRPLVGVLFRAAWARSRAEPATYAKELLALRVLDPAMGSAHLLTVVALEIAKELAWLVTFGAPQPDDHFEVLANPDPWAGVAGVSRLQERVRAHLPEIVGRCCFGVDIRPLACELGKLALWLFTMTVEPEAYPPLTFVDGHVRTGDSLVGVTRSQAISILRDRLGKSWPEASDDDVRWLHDLAVLAVWYPSPSALLDALGVTSDAELMTREDVRAVARRLAKKVRAFHWELEFPDVMRERKFDGIVANPPFRGDRDLRDFIGKECVSYLKASFSGGAVVDYATFFLLRYEDLLGQRGVIATLGTNTLAQGKNRRAGLGALVGREPPWTIFRAVRNRPWPGEAAVFVCLVHLARGDAAVVPEAKLVTTERAGDGSSLREIIAVAPRISSFLDELPDVEGKPLPTMMAGMAFQGMQHMGPFECGDDFVRAVPEVEREGLRAYLNNEDIQQQVSPLARRCVIDVWDALTEAGLGERPASEQLAWLRRRFPTLLAEIERQRSGGTTSADATFWWRFHRSRDDLREAWRGLDEVIAFGRVGKVFAPTMVPTIDPRLGLRICPSDAVLIAPTSSRTLLAVLSSFPFELHVRRSCSTLETRLRVTPSEAFPTFPLPWPASWSENERRPIPLPAPQKVKTLLEAPIRAIAALRASILVGERRASIPVDRRPEGPTDLYNLYDDPSVTFAAVEELRALHVALTDALLEAYGWNQDGPDGPRLRLAWTFDRPWIDGTPRYVPDMAGRRALIVRLAKRNAARFREEMTLCLARLLPLLPAKGLAVSGIDRWRKDLEVGLSRDSIISMLDHGVDVGALTVRAQDERRVWLGR